MHIETYLQVCTCAIKYTPTKKTPHETSRMYIYIYIYITRKTIRKTQSKQCLIPKCQNSSTKSMEQKSPRSKVQNFFQFGLHKPIDAPDYYHPKFIPFFFKKKKEKSKQIQKLNITRAKSYHMLKNLPDIIKRSISHM